jgi:glutamate formiminotransferase/formiminotetrahydrofolate cyclodeaminase
MSKQAILECVPNFSEGRRPEVIEAIAAAVRSVEGAKLLHTDTSPAANRSVLTFAGAPAAVGEAAFRAIAKAAELIDMRSQAGVHPRIGATDVCPLVPLSGMSMEEAHAVAEALGSRVGNELGIPVYFYEYSAKAEHRRALPDIRKGQYEGFAEKMLLPEWAPDFGPRAFTPKSGATIIGARKLLVAFNVSLDTDDVTVATRIAARLRTSGRMAGSQRAPGLLPQTRAIGWFMADYRQAQVSFNLLDYRVTSPLQAFEACKAAAHDMGVGIAGSEVIGLMPEACMLEAGAFARRSKGQSSDVAREQLVHEAILHLGLDRLKPFDPQEKILEWALAAAGLYL